MEFVMTILEGAWRYVTTIRIADYLDCSVDYLLGRTDNPDVNK